MPEEHSPLQQCFITGYDQADKAFPIVACKVDPREDGYTIPAALALCPDPRYSTHVFVGVTPIVDDRRVLWNYMLLPGATVTSSSMDREMNVKITVSRTKDKIANITEGAVISGSGASTILTITEKETGTVYWATKIVTVIPRPDCFSLATALVSTNTMPYQFPARIDIDLLDQFGTAIGHQQPSARLVKAKVKTWWEIKATEPTIDIDEIIPATIWINNVKYTDVLHDLTTRYYENPPPSSTPFTFEATTPSNSEYVASWIGNEKLIDAKTTPLRYQQLWKAEAIYLVMR